MDSTSQSRRAGRLGRPRRLSRELIAGRVAEQLRAEPQIPLTMARAATACEATPVALYRYVSDRKDLLGAVVEHVLGELELRIPTGAPWEVQLATWMRDIVDHLGEVPQCIEGLGGSDGLSPAWLRSSAVLHEILTRAGLHGEARGRALYFTAMNTIGYLQLTATISSREQAAAFQRGVSGRKDDDLVRSMAASLESVSVPAFDVMVDLVVRAVASLVAEAAER